MTRENQQIVAHRGGKGKAPENSRMAINNALTAGINWIEVDARITRDGRIVVHHDATIGRTTNGHGFVRRKTLPQLRRYRLANGESIATLEEIIDLVAGRANLWIDIKGGVRTAEAVVRIVRKKEVENSVVMSSMRPWVIKRIRSLSDLARTSLFAFFSCYKVWLGKRLGVEFIQPRFLLTKRFLARARKANLHVITWPVATGWETQMKKVLFLDFAGKQK